MTRSPINDAIRRAAGRNVPFELEPPPGHLGPAPLGDLGLGRGGAATPMRAPTSHDNVNASIRNAFRLEQQFLVPGGLNIDGLDVDDLLG